MILFGIITFVSLKINNIEIYTTKIFKINSSIIFILCDIILCKQSFSNWYENLAQNQLNHRVLCRYQYIFFLNVVVKR